jgi:hypothetical protein
MHVFCTPFYMNISILPASLLLALLILVSSCGKVEDPQFRRLEHFGIQKIDLKQAVVGFDATFFNPNKFGVNVKEAVLDIYIDSAYLGKFAQARDVAVTSDAEFSIPLEGNLSWKQTLNSEWKKQIGKEVLLKATGAVKVGKAGVFITKNIAYQGRHKLDMSLLKNPAGAGFFQN